jgi:hypothetical protein
MALWPLQPVAHNLGMEALTQWLMSPGAPDVPHTPADVLNRPDWHERAICRGRGVGQWVGDSRMSSYAAQRALCDICPVQRDCLEYALAHPALVGCWGGTTEHERRKLRAAASRRRSA